MLMPNCWAACSGLLFRDTIHVGFRERHGFTSVWKSDGAWADLEKALYGWFEHVTLLDTRKAQPIYFAPNGFRARADMLRAAIDNFGLEAFEEKFVSKALGLAIHYSAFRNKLAHGEFTIEGLIVESGQPDRRRAREEAITQEQLKSATQRFQASADLLWKARDLGIGMTFDDDPDASLEACIKELEQLPRFGPAKQNEPPRRGSVR
jgi:hypothetical protein